MLNRTEELENFFSKIIILRIKTYAQHNYYYGKLIKTWFDGDLFLAFLSLFFGCTLNRGNESGWVSVHSIRFVYKCSLRLYIVLLSVESWEAAAICFYECCTIGVNNNVDYYYSESLQLQLIWLAAVGTFSSHNGSRIDSKNIILNEHFVFDFFFLSKTRSRSSIEKSLYDELVERKTWRNLVQPLDTLQWPKFHFLLFFLCFYEIQLTFWLIVYSNFAVTLCVNWKPGLPVCTLNLSNLPIGPSFKWKNIFWMKIENCMLKQEPKMNLPLAYPISHIIPNIVR